MKPPAHYRGFTLIEILAVIGIVVLLLSLVLPMFGHVNDSRLLTQTSNILQDELNLARTQAVTHQHPVELCFISSGTPPVFRAVQTRKVQPDGEYQWSGRIRSLGDRVAIVPEYSSVVDTQTITTLATEPGTTQGVALRFYPSGRVERVDTAASPLPADAPYLTLTVALARTLTSNEAASLPANFVTLQVHPRSGRVTRYAP